MRMKIGPVYVYITTYRMKRRGNRDDLYRNNRRKLSSMRHELWKRQKGQCCRCGRTFGENELEVHHIEPVSRHPELIVKRSNLQLLCHECHVSLHEGIIRR